MAFGPEVFVFFFSSFSLFSQVLLVFFKLCSVVVLKRQDVFCFRCKTCRALVRQESSLAVPCAVLRYVYEDDDRTTQPHNRNSIRTYNNYYNKQQQQQQH